MDRLRDAIVMFGVACAVPCLAAGRAAAVQVFLGADGMDAIADGPDDPNRPAQKVVADVKAVPAKRAVQAPAKKAFQVELGIQKAAVKDKAAAKDKAAVKDKAALNKAQEDALEAQAAQFIPQIRPMFRAEYYFIRNACDLNHDQRLALARLGEKATKAAARAFVDAQQQMMRGGFRPGMSYPDPHVLIQEELRKAAPDVLTPPQRARYEQETGRRAAAWKQTVVDNIVAKLDNDLVLTEEQRSRIAEGIVANWKDSWGQSIEMLQNLDNFFPDVPDKAVVPHLTENQKAAWRRIPRNSGVIWGFGGGMMQDNDPLDDPELLQAQKEANGEKNPAQPEVNVNGVIRGRVIRRIR